MKSIMKNIEDGSFAREWTLEQETGKKRFEHLWKTGLKHPMLEEEDKLYKPIFGNSRFCFLKKDLIKNKNKMIKFD